MDAWVCGLPHLSITVVISLRCLYVVLTHPSYSRMLHANHNTSNPEWWVPPVILDGVLLVTGLSWFDGPENSRVYWIVPTISGVWTIFGILTAFH
ncbi:hypothetical protein B0O99DRAFT_712617 [Bisporella sp. PMI_857]|nr:hypothetical protein B0O99DRAFT_712617 [Bisporella sp. PMI_857]